jgi:hypothetical protein
MGSSKLSVFSVISAVLILVIVLVGAVVYSQPPVVESVVQESPVHRFADATAVDDAFARLTRYNGVVTAVISTDDLVAGDVYTLWWVVFNAPENCSNGVCDLDDIFAVDENGSVPRDADGNRVMNMDGIAAAEISVLHAAGGYSEHGSLSTSAWLREGATPWTVFGAGLLDAETAEIHLVVRTHGPKLDGAFADQLSTFGGGCEPMDAAPCDDVQFAIFMPTAN